MDRNISQLVDAISALNKNQSILQDQINDLYEAKMHSDRDRYISDMAAINSSSWSGAVTYTNLIVLAGYAGYFGLLSATKDYISPFGLVLSGLFIALSLTIFVFYEVFKMALFNYFYEKLFSELNDNDDVVSNVNKLEERHSVLTNSLWRYTFIPTVVLGVLGAGTLICSFIISLLPMFKSLLS